MLRYNQFVGHDILADDPYMLPGRRCCNDFSLGTCEVNIFDHDYCIRASRHHIASIHHKTTTRDKRRRSRLHLQPDR